MPDPVPPINNSLSSATVQLALPESVAAAQRGGNYLAVESWVDTTLLAMGYIFLVKIFPYVRDIADSEVPINGQIAEGYFTVPPPPGDVIMCSYGGTQQVGLTLPGVSIAGSETPGAVGAPVIGGGPNEMMAVIGNIVPPIGPIIVGLNNQLNEIGGGGGGGGGPNMPGIIPPIVGNIQGQLDAALETAAGFMGKFPGKIGDQLVGAMGEVYGTGIGLGIDVPTVDEIIGGNVGFQFGPVGNTGFGGSGGAPAPDIIQEFGIVGGGGFGGLGGGVVLPGPAPVGQIQGGGIGQGNVPGRAPGVAVGVAPAPVVPVVGGGGVNIVGGPIRPPEAGRPIAGGAFAPVAPVAPIFNPPQIGGGGGGVVGFPIGGGVGAGGVTGYSGESGPAGYMPGSYPPGYYPPGSYPPAGDYNYQGGDYSYQGGDYSYDGGNYAPVSTNINNSVSTATTTYQGDTTTSTTTTTNNNTAPPYDDQKMKSTAPEAPAAEPCPPVPVIPPFAPLAIPRFVNKAKPTNWEFGAACDTPANPGAYDESLLWEMFGWKKIGVKTYEPPSWLQPLNWPLLTQSFASMLMNAYGLVISQLNLASSAANPILNNFPDFITLAGAGIAEKWLGAPILPFLQGTIYNINYNNPQLLPGIPDLQGLFRKGAISEEVFRCLVRANGSYDSWQMKIAESSTLVPSLFDIIRLIRGKKLTTTEFNYYANLNGIKTSSPQGQIDLGVFLEATRAIPGVADLVRMMVRDAADNTIALKYGTDTDFANKFAGQLQEWSEQQGVDPEIMKYYWRSHWEIPSNTQLFDMLHKLRPNRRVGNIPANIVTTPADVKQAIQVNDLTPYWVDRVMATSYSSLTRIDAQRAFFIEAINEDELFDAYMDLGYDKATAQVLVDFTKELKRKRDSNLPGADKPVNIISQLKKYLISETNAYDRLRATGMKPQQAKKAVSNSVRDRKEEARERCLKEAQRRFFRAEYDLLKYKSVVMQLGIPQENIEALVNETACLYDSRGKEINAGALCKAFKQNIIAFDQFQNRLRLIGYDKDESYIIAESCQIDKVVALGKAKLQKETKEKAEIEKAKKAEIAAQEKAEKKAEKAKKAQEAEEKKKAKDNPAPV